MFRIWWKQDLVIAETLMALHWLPFKFRCQYKLLLHAFKALHGLAPSYLGELIHFYKPARSLVTREHTKALQASTVIYDRILPVFRIWWKQDLIIAEACCSILRVWSKKNLLYGVNASIVSILQRIQNTAARLVTRKKKYEHITPTLVALHRKKTS
jgi:hypothetical protein